MAELAHPQIDLMLESPETPEQCLAEEAFSLLKTMGVPDETRIDNWST